MENKSYICNTFFETYSVIVVGSCYCTGKCLAIELIIAEGKEKGQTLSRPSVNLPGEELSDKSCCAFIDINNCPWAIKFLLDNKIAVDTDRVAYSGFCVYPEFKFDLNKIHSFDANAYYNLFCSKCSKEKYCHDECTHCDDYLEKVGG